ncbi:MAG: hypothetical protein ACYCZR_03775 [Burkholderiales bacterium]
MNLAAKAQGRIIHQSFDITMIPPQDGELGETDMAFEIGKGLIREAIQLLRAAAEKEGFTVEIEFGQVVY